MCRTRRLFGLHSDRHPHGQPSTRVEHTQLWFQRLAIKGHLSKMIISFCRYLLWSVSNTIFVVVVVVPEKELESQPVQEKSDEHP